MRPSTGFKCLLSWTSSSEILLDQESVAESEIVGLELTGRDHRLPDFQDQVLSRSLISPTEVVGVEPTGRDHRLPGFRGRVLSRSLTPPGCFPATGYPGWGFFDVGVAETMGFEPMHRFPGLRR